MKKIGIIGGTKGIGASLARFLEQTQKEPLIVSGRKTPITNKEIVETCDLVIFAVPIDKTCEVINEMVPFSREDQIWCDLTSIKVAPVDSMLASKAEVCGGHPLFGPLHDIAGQKLVLTPARITEASLKALKQYFASFEILETTPEKHDEIMGTIQNLSHFADFVLGKTLKDSGVDIQEILNYASPPYRIKLDLLARIFAQNPSLYAQISIHNKSGRMLEKNFMKATNFFQEKIREGDTDILVKEFEAIKNFLGTPFCDQNWERSQALLKFEQTLNQTPSASLVPLIDPETVPSRADWAIFGQAFSHTDEASLLVRKKTDSVVYFRNIFQIFQAVESGTMQYGLVPYENSTKGSIFETLDELFDRPEIRIIGSVKKEISQNLLVLPGTRLADIKEIISHPQALAQSQKFLRKKCPEAYLQNRRSTAIAALEVKERQKLEKAAIGSAWLAEQVGLKVLCANMQEAANETRFVIIASKTVESWDKPTHTSFVFWFSGDGSGNLAHFLTCLSDKSINLTKLDSRRATAKFGGYLFFVDAEITPKAFKRLLPELKDLCAGIRVLGHF